MIKKLLAILGITFCIAANAQYSKIFDFNGTNGLHPSGDLITDGTFLYGATNYGGVNGTGNFFKIEPNGTGFLDLMDCAGPVNGEYPSGTLFFDGTFLYGMTQQGGANGKGTIFEIKPNGTSYSKLLDFTGVNGNNPSGGLISDGTFLYGMTTNGGVNSGCSLGSGCGTVFKIKPNGTGDSVLQNMSGTLNGYNPMGSLISDGTFLYGMTAAGGMSNDGMIFRMKKDGTGDTVLLSFNGTANGSFPTGTLIYDGTFLYGTTAMGGANGDGTIFRIKPDGTGYLKMHDFSGADGNQPGGSLLAAGAYLFGMTSVGGANNYGVIFKVKSDGSGYSVIHDFDTNGSSPRGSFVSDGTFLYAMTYGGGTTDNGTIFKFNFNCTPVIFSQSPVVCSGQSVHVGSNTYSVTGTYTDVIQNGTSTGCDSTVITNLTVLPKYASLSKTICNGQSLTIGTHTYTAGGIYIDTLISSHGCDSILTTHLTVLSSSSSTSQTVSICSGNSVYVGTDSYSTSGTYTYTFQGGTCDSTVITYLTVNPTPTASISGDTAILCDATTTTLTASGGGTYLWNTGSTNSSIIVSPHADSVYSVIVTNGMCSDTASVNVAVHHTPIAGFWPQVSTCCASSWYFTDTTHALSGDPIVGWSWTFSGGFPATATTSAVGVGLSGGTHTVCLTVTTAHGCKDSTCQVIFSMNEKDISVSSSVLVYPNPAKETITIELQGGGIQDTDFRIMDVLGNVVVQQKIEKEKFDIDISSLREGIYNISLQSKRSQVNKKLLVIK